MIGILDSGIGGLSVLKEIERILPDQGIYYLADTLHCPYGGRPKNQIVDLSRECVKFLKNQQVDIVVLACNTITSAAAEVLRSENPNLPIVGMEPAIKPAAEISISKVVGVLATQATLNGELYRHTKNEYAQGVEVIEVAGEGLVELVEKGLQNSPEAIKLIRRYLKPMMDRRADVLVLGCTHFPFLTKAINIVANNTLKLIDPAPAVARRTKEIMQNCHLLNQKTDKQMIYKSTLSDEATDFLEKTAQKVLSDTGFFFE